MSHESIERFDPAKEWPLIAHGLPYPNAVARHLKQTLRCTRPFFLISRSLSRDAGIVDGLKAALSKDVEKLVSIAGVHPGMQPHSHYSEILEIAQEVREAGADSIVTIGGGSLVDGAKVVSLAVANDTTTHKDLDLLLRTSNSHRPSQTDPLHGNAPAAIQPPSLPIISVTTTLSAGEFNAGGGATNDQTKHKQRFWPPNGRGISVIIMDPSLTTTTPERVWLSTGMRAVDHCVESICSSNPSEEGTTCSLRGIRRLIPGLLRVKKNPGDLEARLSCQLGSADSMRASQIYGAHMGASHGIGHQLGPMGVPHAETTCICLPAVQKYNVAQANNANNANAVHQAQALLLDIFWTEPDIATALERRGLVRGGDADLGDALDAVIRELGLPRTLQEYGIVGQDQLDRIAESSLRDSSCQRNVVPLERKEQILEILNMCLGHP